MPVVKINDHDMYYEIHGTGDPLLVMGGWGTYCHGGEKGLPRGLTDRYSVVIFDYRGIGESSDDVRIPASMQLHAHDAIGLLEHLNFARVHMVGLVGIGACICQEIAITRPELVRSIVNTGAWCYVDDFLRDQLEMFRWLHRDAGFYAFQKAVTLLSFDPQFYNANRDRLLGPAGGWKELNGNYVTHSRLIDACIGFNSQDRLSAIKCPALIIHAGADQVTSPRMTLPIEAGIPGALGVLMQDVAHVVAGKEQKQRFCDILLPFLASH